MSIFQGFYDKVKRESRDWWGDSPQYFSGVSFNSHAEYKNNAGISFLVEIFLMTLDIKKVLKTGEEDSTLVL